MSQITPRLKSPRVTVYVLNSSSVNYNLASIKSKKTDNDMSKL